MNNFTVIAEIGCTHIGQLERAKNLAKLAKICGADVLKTQKRNPKESTKKELWDKPHPNEMYAYGKTYLEHRENVELPIEDHYELKKYCEEIGIEYSTSVWDITSAKEIVELNPKLIKIPSACNQNYELITYLFDNYDGEIHISGPPELAREGSFCQLFLIPCLVLHKAKWLSAGPQGTRNCFLWRSPRLYKGDCSLQHQQENS